MRSVNQMYSRNGFPSIELLVFNRYKKKAKVIVPATVNSLRNSFATHLLDAGTNLRYILKLLGHNSSRTTEIYTHVSTSNLVNIESPFEKIVKSNIFGNRK